MRNEHHIKTPVLYPSNEATERQTLSHPPSYPQTLLMQGKKATLERRSDALQVAGRDNYLYIMPQFSTSSPQSRITSCLPVTRLTRAESG